MDLLKKDIINDAQSLLNFLYPEYPFGEYNPVYLFTNEDVDIILKNVNLSGKILSVNASGDQVLNAILMGARDVQMFDLNKFTKYFTSLKIEAIKNLKYEEFLRLYNIGVRKNGAFMYDVCSPKLDKEMILKVYEKLSNSYGLFFEKLLEFSFFEDENNFSKYFMHNFKPESNRYLDKEEYYKLQRLLPEVKINNYIDCDIFDIKEHIGNSKYSTMLFSNISSYFDEISLEEYYDLLVSLGENLTDDGIIQIGYGKNKSSSYGSNPLDRTFVDEHKDKIIEFSDKKIIITYYHK